MPKYKPDKTVLLLGGVFFMVGVVIIVILAALKISYVNFEKKADRVSAVISSISSYRTGSGSKKSTHYDVDITYLYNGESYTHTLNFYESGMHEGDIREILVDPDDPRNIKMKSKLATPFLLIFAVAFGGVGAALLWSEVGTVIRANALIKEDRYVICEDWEERKANVSVNNVRYHEILARYSNGFTDYEFKSRPFNPSKQPYTEGENVTVYVDIENDPKKYFVYLKD